MILCSRSWKSLINLSKDNDSSTKTKGLRTDAANYTQCKSLKSIVKDHGPRTYIILNPYSEASSDGNRSNFQDWGEILSLNQHEVMIVKPTWSNDRCLETITTKCNLMNRVDLIVVFNMTKIKSWRTRFVFIRLQTYKIGMWYFSSKHAILRSKNKDWMVQNQDNVSECGDMSIHGLLFQWASTIKKNSTKRVGLVQSGPHDHLIENIFFLPWYSWKIGELRLNNISLSL